MMESLTVPDRLALLSILPSQGDITTIKIVRKLREELSFTEQEHEQYGIVVEEGKVTWNESVNGVCKDIEVGRKAVDVIVVALQGLDENKRLEPGHTDIWDRFVTDD
jgi:hypothetical protein